MPLLRRTPVSLLDERLCLGCGYRGPELQGPSGLTEIWCPDCGEDLYSRPARSYRELEGLDAGPELPADSEPLAQAAPGRPPGRVGRWLARALRRFAGWF